MSAYHCVNLAHSADRLQSQRFKGGRELTMATFVLQLNVVLFRHELYDKVGPAEVQGHVQSAA